MPCTDDQVMMCLAGLAYRGFADPGVGTMHERRVRRVDDRPHQHMVEYLRQLKLCPDVNRGSFFDP
jgi:hypothetical protein